MLTLFLLYLLWLHVLGLRNLFQETNKFYFQLFHGRRNLFQETTPTNFPSNSFTDEETPSRKPHQQIFLPVLSRTKKPLPGNLTNKFSFQFFHGRRNLFQETSPTNFPSNSFTDEETSSRKPHQQIFLPILSRTKKPLPGNLTKKDSFHFFHGRHLHGHLFPQQMFNIQSANFGNEFPNNVCTYTRTFPLFPTITYAFHYALKCNFSVMDDIKMDLRQKELESVYWIYVLRLEPLVGPCENTMDFVVFLKCKGYLE